MLVAEDGSSAGPVTVGTDVADALVGAGTDCAISAWEETTGADSGGVFLVTRAGDRRRATYVRGSWRPSASRAVGSAPLIGRATPRGGEWRRAAPEW